jgi:IPT/TIG domain/Ig-like domain from next to BRCA1 gene
MRQSTRRILFSVITFLILLASCAPPAPSATQDSGLVDRVVEQAVTLTLAAQESQAKDQQIRELSNALTAVAQQAILPTQTPSSEAEPVEALPDITDTPSAPNSEPASTATFDPNAPTVTGISPNQGSMEGGDTVTITGTNFAIGKGHTRFFFGDKEATNVECISAAQCTVKVPAGTERNVTVTARLTTDRPENSTPDTFNYIPVNPNQPVITRITPREGSMRGGTTVIIEGRNFLGGKLGSKPDATKFYFGANAATDVVCETDIECKVISPAGQAGIVIVKAENKPADGSAPVESEHIEGNDYDGFKYQGPVKYGCSALTVKPKKGTVLGKGEHFTISWIVMNTGQNAWPAGIDVKYAGGVQLSGVTRVQIPTALQPNQSYGFDLDAVAPDNAGIFYMNWIVEGMGCNVYVAINVE